MIKFLRIIKNRKFFKCLGLPFLIFLWYSASLIVRAVYTNGDLILPSPVEVLLKSLPGFATFWENKGIGIENSYTIAFMVLLKHSTATLLRVFSGLFLGILSGVFVALIMGWSFFLRNLLDGPINLIRAIPTLALIPLFLLWFGGREIGNLIFIIFSIFVILVISTLEAIRNVPPVYTEFASTLGANRRHIYKTVIIPAIIPGITGGIRVALGTSWAITLGAEYLAVDVGLGKLLILSEMFFFTGRMIVIVILFGIFSTTLNYITVRTIKYITRWVPS